MCERLKDYADLMRLVCEHMHAYEAQINCPSSSSDVVRMQTDLAYYILCGVVMHDSTCICT